MNFGEYKFGEQIEQKLIDLTNDNRLPHAVMITGGDSSKREDMISFICSYAMCVDDSKPCFECKGCNKVKTNSHPDIIYVETDSKRKTPIYSKDVIDEVIRKTTNIPNEGNIKIFVLRDVDEKLPVISQNALLKTLEEPSQKIMFILTGKSAGDLLETVLSRCVSVTIPAVEEYSEAEMQLAEEIALAIVDVNEYNLLRATYKLNKKEVALSVLMPLRKIFRDCLVYSVGGELENVEVPKKLIRKLTREKILRLLNILDSARTSLDSNVNMNLFCTWLCTEFRRITWQK